MYFWWVFLFHFAWYWSLILTNKQLFIFQRIYRGKRLLRKNGIIDLLRPCCNIDTSCWFSSSNTLYFIQFTILCIYSFVNPLWFIKSSEVYLKYFVNTLLILISGHYGAFLQDDWDLVAEILRYASQRLSVPVTCKIRVLGDVERTVQYAQLLESAGVKVDIFTRISGWGYIPGEAR